MSTEVVGAVDELDVGGNVVGGNVVGLAVVGAVTGAWVVGGETPVDGGGVQPPLVVPVEPWFRVVVGRRVVVVVLRRRVVDVLVVADLTDAVGAGVVTDTRFT